MNRKKNSPALWGLMLLFLLGATAQGAQNASSVKFVDITRSARIDFKHSFGDEHLTSILEATGSGAAFLDYDNDGDQDLYVVNCSYLPGTSAKEGAGLGALKNQLYQNDGTGKFTNVTEAAGVGDTGYGMGCGIGDYDNDGNIDLYVANYGPNVLYRNRGDGTFENVTQKAGVAGPEKNVNFQKWTLNAQFFDYDLDGDLDLYLANYLEFDPNYTFYYLPEGFPGPEAYLGQPDILYRNNGDGTFTDVSKEVGIQLEITGKTMGAGIGDFDGDGLSDIATANDAMENFLFKNMGDGTFKNVGIDAGIAFGQGGENVASMHPCFGDVNNDGMPDLFIPDMTFNSLLKNIGGGHFEDIIMKTGTAHTSGHFVSWGGGFLDYDNDGFLDIFIANGGAHHLYGQQALLWKGKGDGTFDDVSLSSGDFFRIKRTMRGAAWADIDNDGDLDIFVQNIDLKGTPSLLRNDGGNAGHWLTVKALSIKGRDAFGAKLKLTAGGLTQERELFPGGSYESQCDVRVHFGLGKNAKVDKLEIHWPGSKKPTVLKKIDADQIIEVQEGSKKFKKIG